MESRFVVLSRIIRGVHEDDFIWAWPAQFESHLIFRPAVVRRPRRHDEKAARLVRSHSGEILLLAHTEQKGSGKDRRKLGPGVPMRGHARVRRKFQPQNIMSRLSGLSI